MEYEGLEQVKLQFLDLKSKIEICKEQGRPLNTERFNIVFQGNPGTGKTTVARLYARLLRSLNVLQANEWVVKETSGIKIARKGSQGIKKKIKKIVEFPGDGGVLIVDEAYQLTSPYANSSGRSALDAILALMENNVGKLAVVFLGYRDEMESFFEHNPGLRSRIPFTMNFEDFANYELLEILSNIITRQQAQRLTRERRVGGEPDPYLFTKEDILGPNPSTAVQTSEAWQELQNLVGLEKVKESVKSLIGSLEINYQRELHELTPIAFSLNQVFLGQPGTGKTTVARLYGRILTDLGYLSRGEVILKTPADFIGEYLGQSEAQTKRILEASVGKVLVIDEAYVLDPGGERPDDYKAGIIDTIVSMVQGQPFEDRCIILVGYEDKIKNMFRNANPGLSRRFPLEQPFRFENFTIQQLELVLQSKMKNQDLECTDQGLAAARDIFKDALRRGNCTNAGVVDSALETAKQNYTRRLRLSDAPFSDQYPNPKLQAVDFNLGLSRNPRVDFQKMEGRVHKSIIDQLGSYQRQYWNAKNRSGVDPKDLDLIPTRFIFHGPPGTGKTTAANMMAELFYSIGYISMPRVVEYYPTDFIAQYIGQTRHRTRQKLTEAIGRLLFIGDICRLLKGTYENEAVDELKLFLSQPAHRSNVIVILEGDTDSVNELMRSPGISSVLYKEIIFENIPPDDCISLLRRHLEHSGLAAEADFLGNPHSPDYDKVKQLLRDIQSIPGWSNARDVKQLAIEAMGKLFDLDDDQAQNAIAEFPTIVAACIVRKIIQKATLYSETGSNDRTSRQLEKLVDWEASAKLASYTQSTQLPPRQASTATARNLEAMGNYAIDRGINEIGFQNRAHESSSKFQTAEARVENKKPEADEYQGKEETEDSEANAMREEGVPDYILKHLERKIETQSRRHAWLKSEVERLERERQDAGDRVVNLMGEEWDKLEEKISAELKVKKELLQNEEKIQEALRKFGLCEAEYGTGVDEGDSCEDGSHFVTEAEVPTH
ncbi:P-loop containing nucleoside triphosphate hydrolase protein [Hypoxylon sp. NC1633]|nr:P-loop containing nucleoside triphosphate hydrolase protein [Hypoxylon sp. NC1633]